LGFRAASTMPEPRKMDTRATAANRAMVGFFMVAMDWLQAALTLSPGIPWMKMVRMATSMNGMVPGRYR